MENCDLEKLKGKNWMAAMALCWLFGAFGAHRFYTGKTKSAWTMLAFSVLGLTAPISALWMFIDGVVLALGQFTHADGSELYERKPAFGYFYIAFVAFFIIVGILLFVLSTIFAAAALYKMPSLQTPAM